METKGWRVREKWVENDREGAESKKKGAGVGKIQDIFTDWETTCEYLILL